ncbi:MAG: HMA2 domain-containing protein [bacterium]
MGNGEIRAVHAIPGRVRFKVPRIKQDPAFEARIRDRLSAIKSIQRVEVNPVTGSVLLLYDPQEIRLPGSLFPLLSAFTSLFPEVNLEQLKTSLASPGVSSGSDVPLASKISECSGALNERLKKVGGADLKIILPITLFGLGVRSLMVAESIPVPAWYDFLWFSFGTFFMLNPIKNMVNEPSNGFIHPSSGKE